MIPEDAMRKIRKCLALASSSNQAEAAAAMRQAQKLMDMHGVTEGALDRAAVKASYIRGKAGAAPSEWENRLVWLCCHAFGGKPLWSKGPKGGKTDADNGWWTFLAEGERAELIKYAYAVLVRQVLAARAKRSAEWHIGLSHKVAPHALDDRARAALDAAIDDTKTKDAPNAKIREAAWASAGAILAGAADGKKASFYAAAKGREVQLKLGSVPS